MTSVMRTTQHGLVHVAPTDFDVRNVGSEVSASSGNPLNQAIEYGVKMVGNSFRNSAPPDQPFYRQPSAKLKNVAAMP